MSADPFGKWWPCLKKHYKRRSIWLPEIRRIAGLVPADRSFRYFTLCARPMIDIYLLVKEKILPYDQENRRITGAFFCECEEAAIGEMRELVGAEEAGLCGFLEDIVLFEDLAETKPLSNYQKIDAYFTREGEGMDPNVRERLMLKRKYLNFRKLFPFDFINLDYCDPYYGTFPDVLRVHEAVERIIDWQTGTGLLPDTTTEYSVDRFVLAVTCRTDQMIDASARKRLKEIVENNCADHSDYKREVARQGKIDVGAWQNRDDLDFFMAAWPKEIARLANAKGWEIDIRNHCFYERVGDSGEPYHMVCLVAEFTRAKKCTTYLPAAMKCLDAAARSKIVPFDMNKGDGKVLLDDLTEVVELRNAQARSHKVFELPDPRTEILRLRAAKVAI